MTNYILRTTTWLQRINIDNGTEEPGGYSSSVINEATTSDNYTVGSMVVTNSAATPSLGGVSAPATVIIRNKGAVDIQVSMNSAFTDYCTIKPGSECRLPNVANLANLKLKTPSGSSLASIHIFQIA